MAVPSQCLNGLLFGVCSVLLRQTSLLCSEQASRGRDVRLTLLSSFLEGVLELLWILPQFAKRLWDRNVHTCEIALGTKGHVRGLINNICFTAVDKQVLLQAVFQRLLLGKKEFS